MRATSVGAKVMSIDLKIDHPPALWQTKRINLHMWIYVRLRSLWGSRTSQTWHAKEPKQPEYLERECLRMDRGVDSMGPPIL